MASVNADTLVRLDLNNALFQASLLSLQKPTRHAALHTLHKICQLPWKQLYRDGGLQLEEISSTNPPSAIDAYLIPPHYPIPADRGILGRRLHLLADSRT